MAEGWDMDSLADGHEDGPSVEQAVHAFLIERRLTLSEADAVIKILKNDSALGYVLWTVPVREVAPELLHRLNHAVCRKVLAWMDKYREKHPARALFTGAS